MNTLYKVGLLSIFLLQGCATTYQKQGFSGGFKETQLAEDRFRVSFRGNAFISKDKVIDYALRRSAEVCVEKGFPYFAIIDSNSEITNHTVSTPAYATTTGSIYGNSYTGNTTISGGQPINFKKPSASNLVHCFKEKPKGIYTYEAKFILNSISTERKKIFGVL
ncbi:MAG: hypothetical protein NZ824_01360 [Candidatus Thioglobus sp.]|nr:hypothetical protein [Candidatus Thioglobus sp.]